MYPENGINGIYRDNIDYYAGRNRNVVAWNEPDFRAEGMFL